MSSACLARSLADANLAMEHLPGLLMHHRCWRINQCHGVDRRTPLRNILIGWVGELASAPTPFLRRPGVAGGWERVREV
jgi:hypothetical protein